MLRLSKRIILYNIKMIPKWGSQNTYIHMYINWLGHTSSEPIYIQLQKCRCTKMWSSKRRVVHLHQGHAVSTSLSMTMFAVTATLATSTTAPTPGCYLLVQYCVCIQAQRKYKTRIRSKPKLMCKS